MSDLNTRLKTALEKLQAENGLRSLRELEFGAPPSLCNFASNDYLGWSKHPALIEAATAATRKLGTGASASRLLGGTGKLVSQLEEEIAQWKKTEAALMFGSGYAAAMGTVPALVGSSDVVIVDKLAHACLIDAAKLSGAYLRVYPHNNMAKLERLLTEIRAKAPSIGILILTESLFSMDGDECRLSDLIALKERYGAWLLVDEAHSTGLYGAKGAGQIAESFAGRVDITMGTLSKALGSVGGFVTGTRTLIDFLVNRARSFIYSTALPAGNVAASLAAVRLAQSDQGEAARQLLRAYVGLFRQSCSDSVSSSAIQPILCGSNSAALERAQILEKHGYFAPAVRYPSVGRNQARLRITLSAKHTPEMILGLAQVLKKTKVQKEQVHSC